MNNPATMSFLIMNIMEILTGAPFPPERQITHCIGLAAG